MGYGNRKGSDSMAGFSSSEPILEQVYVASRLSSVIFLIIVHSCFSNLSPKCRLNASCVYMFPTASYKELKRLIEENSSKNYMKMSQAQTLINGLFHSKPFLCVVATNHKVDKKSIRTA